MKFMFKFATKMAIMCDLCMRHVVMYQMCCICGSDIIVQVTHVNLACHKHNMCKIK